PLLPPSTLFPYTTLFRSACVSRVRASSAAALQLTSAPSARRLWISALMYSAVRPTTLPIRITESDVASEAASGFLRHQRHVRSQDRKSTRLNSSHRTISY